MATLGDDQGTMMALCFEKNTFLDVVQLPAGGLTQQTAGHRRCRSDSGYCGMPHVFAALNGHVVAWPEFSNQSRGVEPASTQEMCREPLVGSRTAVPDAIECKRDWDTAEFQSRRLSQASTMEWQSLQGGSLPNTPVSTSESASRTSSFGDMSFGMDMSPISDRQNTHFGDSFSISDQQSGIVAMPSSVPGSGLASASNCTVPFGSLAHAAGECKPCAHAWRRGGCSKGDQCERCHVCGEEEFREYRHGYRKARRALKRAMKHA